MKKWLDKYDKGGPVKKLNASEIADIKKFIANNADVKDINDPRYYTGKPVVNKAYNVTNRLSAGNLPRYVDPNVKNDPALKWVNAAAILGPIAAMAAPTVAAGAATLAPYLSAPLVVGGSELAAVTPASIAGAYFAHEGYKKLPQTQASVLNAYNNPTRQNILNAANDVGWNTMDFLGTGEAIKGATQLAEPIINKAGKTVVNKLSRLPFENVPVLNQAYKINPWAFTPQEGMMYRGIGKEGMEDAIQSGVFRPKQHGYAEKRSLAERVNTPKQFGSTFYAPAKKFGIVQNYGPNYLAEVPFEGNQFARRYGRKDWSWSTPREIPIEEGRLLKKNWLQGYTPLEVPNTALPTLNNNTVSNKIINSRLFKALVGTDGVLSELYGEILSGKANRKAIEEGNQWMQDWINHPETQRKIVNDMEEAIYNDELINPVNNRNTPLLNLIKEQSLNYRPNAKEYSLLKQIKSNIKQYTSAQAEKPIHYMNSGVSYEHGVHPIWRYNIENKLQDAPDWYGNWISRNFTIGYPKRVGTTVHENTHGWVNENALVESRLKNMSLSNTNEEIRNDVLEWQNLRNEGKTQEGINKIMGKERAYQAYIADPTEMHARTMELRKHFGITPDMKFDENSAADLLERLYKTAELKENKHPITGLRQYLTALDGKPQNFANILNNFWGVLPVGLTIGALNNNQNKPNQYKDGGQIHNWREVKVPHKKNQLSGWLDKL